MHGSIFKNFNLKNVVQKSYISRRRGTSATSPTLLPYYSNNRKCSSSYINFRSKMSYLFWKRTRWKIIMLRFYFEHNISALQPPAGSKTQTSCEQTLELFLQRLPKVKLAPTVNRQPGFRQEDS